MTGNPEKLSPSDDPSGDRVRYIGVDLAWGQVNRTGVAVLDGSGRLLESVSLRTDDEIVRFMLNRAVETMVAAIDAPMIVANEQGQRPVDAIIGRLYGGFGASAHSANRGNPNFVPEPRAARLAAALGWEMDPTVTPARSKRVCIEVYPHPAMVSLFRLSYRIPYKPKPGRSLQDLKDAYRQLFHQMDAVCGPRLRLEQNPRWQELKAISLNARTKAQLKLIEDEVDAIFCAHLAWLWSNDRQQMTVFGDYATGYIVGPNPPLARAMGGPTPRRPDSEGRPGSAKPVVLTVKMDALANAFRTSVPRLTVGESERLASIALQ